MIITKKQTALFVLLIISILLLAIVQVRFTLAQQIGTQQQFGVSSIIIGMQSSAEHEQSELIIDADGSKQTFGRVGSLSAQKLPTGQINNKVSGLLEEAEISLAEFTDLSEDNTALIEDLGTAKTINELVQKWQRLRPELDAAADKVDKAIDNLEEATQTLDKI